MGRKEKQNERKDSQMTNLPTLKEIENAVVLKKLRVKILTTFRTLVDPEFTAPLGKPQYKSVIYRFGDLLTLPETDTGRLPYWTHTDRALEPKKINCVLAIVSCVVVGYWHVRVAKGTLDTSVIDRRLDQLRYIVKHWDELKVAGSIRERYYLAGIPELEEPKDEQEERVEIPEKDTETKTD